ncbi:MCM DNA helicase complex subunit [Spiromyces aspiralis]|uniref:MCM DNA helicase complex subunit n=1 Tax=Spiromyces aspiralis TaxID=68401 RepID=A0ACC1HUK3_9FUNG|nr:MCM DNA helicase complex subunit [Spiromyces aspiralis]
MLEGSEGTSGDGNTDGNAAGSEGRDCPVFEPFNEFLHAGVAAQRARSRRRQTRRRDRRRLLHETDADEDRADGSSEDHDSREILSTVFLKRYIFYAKSLVKPVLSPEAADEIANAYADLRSQAANNGSRGSGHQQAMTTTPITARTLETLIRLATAHAKARLSSRVESQDAEIARRLLRFALFKEPATGGQPSASAGKGSNGRKDPKRMRRDDDLDDSSNDSGEEMATAASRRQGMSRLTRSTAAAAAAIRPDGPTTAMSLDTVGIGAFGDSGTFPVPTFSQQQQQQQQSSGLSTERYERFKALFSRSLSSGTLDGSEGLMAEEQILPAINEGLAGDEVFSFAELETGLKMMEDENRVMYRDGIVFII